MDHNQTEIRSLSKLKYLIGCCVKSHKDHIIYITFIRVCHFFAPKALRRSLWSRVSASLPPLTRGCEVEQLRPIKSSIFAAGRWRRPADPGGKPASGAPSPGRLRATCRGLRSSWRCASAAQSAHALSLWIVSGHLRDYSFS